MGFSKSSSLSLSLLFLTIFTILIPLSTPADLYTLIYKGCSKQNSQDYTFQQTLTTLFNSLISQSSTSHFFKTTAGGGRNSISGLFQCRGDISNADCNNCVKMIPQMASTLCGQAIAGRIHLTGCYMVYQTSDFPQGSGTDLLYKICSSKGANFENKRDTAFGNLETGIAGGSGYYATTYDSVYVTAQCEGDLSVSDCGECVKEAVQRAEVECGNSVAGQVYLNRCYMNYGYYTNGGGLSSGSGQQTGKTVAIVVGGAAALGFAVIFLLFLRSLGRKRDDY
ncbi:plasmodesmata-located protein 2-like [Tasmannia lanceolata]|uniref:plasmodesmata-located protein 2-like n=1 Tax=Tasmannia lanceolata TaxID=3420 RepID=UPI004063DF08